MISTSTSPLLEGSTGISEEDQTIVARTRAVSTRLLCDRKLILLVSLMEISRKTVGRVVHFSIRNV
jgi:hypothetical protein